MGELEKRATVAGGDLVGKDFGDVNLTGVVFTESGVNLDLELPDAVLVGSTSARLVCRWLHSVDIQLDLREQPYAPLSWEGAVVRSAEGLWRFFLRFAGVGDIAVESEEMELERRP